MNPTFQTLKRAGVAGRHLCLADSVAFSPIHFADFLHPHPSDLGPQPHIKNNNDQAFAKAPKKRNVAGIDVSLSYQQGGPTPITITPPKLGCVGHLYLLDPVDLSSIDLNALSARTPRNAGLSRIMNASFCCFELLNGLLFRIRTNVKTQ